MALLTGKDSPRFSQFTFDQFSGNGSQTSFTLSRTPPTNSSIFVTIDGVKQHASSYSLSSNNIVFSEAPSSVSTIEVTHIGSLGPVIAPSDNSVSTTKLINGAVSNTKLDVASADGTGSMMLPTGTTAQRPTTPTAGYVRYNTSLGVVEGFDGSSWISLTNRVNSGGGTSLVYTYNSELYRIHTFTSSGTFTTDSPISADILIVAGGGGVYGAMGSAGCTGGAGAGGFRYHRSRPLVAGNYTVVVGGGGSTSSSASGADSTNKGNNSSFDNLIAYGGGVSTQTNGSPYGDGGSGGGQGVGSNIPTGAFGYGTANQGYNGGAAASTSSGLGGGGGGASEAGNTDGQGFGGDGYREGVSTVYNWETGTTTTFLINGTGNYYAGGGGGGAVTAALTANGGAGGGGRGYSNGATGSDINGTANTGGGGGGAGYVAMAGGAGGSGIVIVRYKI